MERPTYEELAEIAVGAIDRAILDECTVCGSEYQRRFFGPQVDGLHPRIRHTERSRAIGNTHRYCGSSGLHAQRADLIARLELS